MSAPALALVGRGLRPAPLERSPLTPLTGDRAIGSPGGTHPIAVDGDTIHFAWAEDGNTHYRRSHDSGRTWTAPVHLTDGGTSEYPCSLELADGALHLIWPDARNVGGGVVSPGMWLREMSRDEVPRSLQYQGGIEDPTVWNCFQAEGRLSSDYDALDIHTFCRVPEDPELAKEAFFYIDDVFLQAVEEPSLSFSTPLDEYYVGEALPWHVSALSSGGQVTVALRSGGRLVGEQAREAQPRLLTGTFETRGLKPGVYALQATLKETQGAPQTARRQLIIAPDPFDWEEGR